MLPMGILYAMGSLSLQPLGDPEPTQIIDLLAEVGRLRPHPGQIFLKHSTDPETNSFTK